MFIVALYAKLDAESQTKTDYPLLLGQGQAVRSPSSVVGGQSKRGATDNGPMTNDNGPMTIHFFGVFGVLTLNLTLGRCDLDTMRV
jgi:hypothetical protein